MQTQSDIFNKSLEIQQSEWLILWCYAEVHHQVATVDLLSGYDGNAQLNSIEELIYQQAPLSVTLRLICLASITQGGIKQKILDNLKREVLQVCLILGELI